MDNVKKMSKNGVKMMKIDIVNFLQKIQNAKEKLKRTNYKLHNQMFNN